VFSIDSHYFVVVVQTVELLIAAETVVEVEIVEGD
jgi:hypothetical protein